MKHIVGISLGSSERDHRLEMNFGGEPCCIERIGTDGDMKKMISVIKKLDGEVDCFGLGGMDLYVSAGPKRYAIRDALRIVRAAEKTPIVDGSGLKNTLERKVVLHIGRETNILNEANSVLMTSGADRYGMALSLEELGLKVTYGDLLFILGLPIPINSLGFLQRTVSTLAPIVRLLPFKMLYPTGEQQHKTVPRHTKYFDRADIIAGDFHFIYRNMPPQLAGKVVITNTTTVKDVEVLRQAKVKTLVTTTPVLEGRSFGTNVMEALLVALAGENGELKPSEYDVLIEELDLKPKILQLNQEVQG